jgi:hypothetical protein
MIGSTQRDDSAVTKPMKLSRIRMLDMRCKISGIGSAAIASAPSITAKTSL